MDASQRKPHELAFHGFGNRLSQGCLADTRGAHETQDRPFHFRVELAYAQVFKNAVLDFTQAVMLPIEHFTGIRDIQHIFG